MERTRRAVLDHFNAREDEYLCVFTANASAALKLVAESYRFEPGGTFALTFDNHNSVNGIREFATRRGAHVVYVPVRAPDLRVDRAAMTRVLRSGDPTTPNLLAFPAQSNFSGVQHPLELVAEAHAAGWDVLLDTAAFAPTNHLDLARVRPDFACISFYKMMGYPTGAGCLLVRREAAHALVRPWFAGGTVTIASVQGRGHFLQEGEAGFEDGTVDYGNLPAVDIGLRHLRRLGIDRIHARVQALTSWLLEALAGLRHADGRPVVEVLGPCDNAERGGTVAFTVHDRDGQTRISPRSRYISHSSSLTHDLSSSRARCSARRSRPGSYAVMPSPAACASRAARRRSRRLSMYGSITSQRSAMTTIAVAQRATVTAVLLRSARRAREEDHAVSLTRDLAERTHHLGLAPPRRRLDRDRGPHALFELPAELRHEPLLVLPDLDITLGDQLLAVPRAHAEELHGAHYVTRRVPPDRSVAPRRPAAVAGPLRRARARALGPRPAPATRRGRPAKRSRARRSRPPAR